MLFKKMWRTINKYKAQFISMIIMIMLGVGVFLGFNIEWYSIEKDSKKFFDDSNFADYKLLSETGFSELDLQEVKKIEGVDDAGRALVVKVSVDGTKSNLSINALENVNINKIKIISGIDYDSENLGVWLSDKYANTNNLKLGDTITVTYLGNKIPLNIVSLVKASDYMVCVDENQVMPDFTLYGFAYVSPKLVEEKFGFSYFNQIHIKSSLDKKQIEAAVNESLGRNTLVLSLDENASYQASKGEAEEGKTMGTIIPVLFLIIAVLTMVTTMNRLTKNEKTQIGTLKAIGFKDRKILWHYTLYGLIVGAIGSAIGVGLGFLVARIILSPTGMLGTYFDWTSYSLHMPWFCPIVILAIVAIMMLVSFLTVRKILSTSPAETLRPYVPKHIKQTKLEKTKLWKKCSFGFRWNYRDTIRNKSRSLVTLIGVVGCIVLIVGSMGMSNTMDGFMTTLKGSMDYSTKINIAEQANISEINQLIAKHNAEYVSQVSVKFNEKPMTLEIYPDDIHMVNFYDVNNKALTITGDGVYVCERVAKQGVKVGQTITFSPYGDTRSYTVVVAGINKSLVSESITMTSSLADSLGISYKPTSLFTLDDDLKVDSSNHIISSVQTKDKLIKSYRSFFQIMDSMVLILIVSALVLAIIVLYNLGVMSYVERYRELATLKVVGFKNKQISHLLLGQNTILTIIGTVIGLPLGYGVLYWLVKALASEYEMKVRIYFSTYLIAIVLTVGVSVLVGLLISKKNKKINMAEALKDKE